MIGQSIWLWDWEPSILIGLALWTIGYVLVTGRLREQKKWGPPVSLARQISFHLGTLVAFFALVSPLDHLADVFLLSAHMVQHLLLILVSPPLWLVGIPSGLLDPLIPKGLLPKIIRWLTRPITAYLIFNGVFLIWHIPTLYDAALFHPLLHVAEHLSFIAAAVIGWWPMLGFLPKVAPRPAYGIQIFYCFALMLPSIALAAIITFARTPLYPFYLGAPAVEGNIALPAFVNGARLWGLSIMDDQQLSGMIMWVPGNMVYFTVFMVTVSNWFRENERVEQEKTLEESQVSGSDNRDTPTSPPAAG
jgi:cytochrome c oxidase assembly factor CtaG